jgi:transcriptional regulator with PAS, ATPase and Fis domain
MSVDWEREFSAAITICDINGIILDMNNKAAETFRENGGRELIGKNLFDCHLPASTGKIRQQLSAGLSNTYTIEKNGIKKLIHQAPWYENGEVKGLVEISIVIPTEMPHHIRS